MGYLSKKKKEKKRKKEKREMDEEWIVSEWEQQNT